MLPGLQGIVVPPQNLAVERHAHHALLAPEKDAIAVLQNRLRRDVDLHDPDGQARARINAMDRARSEQQRSALEDEEPHELAPWRGVSPSQATRISVQPIGVPRAEENQRMVGDAHVRTMPDPAFADKRPALDGAIRARNLEHVTQQPPLPARLGCEHVEVSVGAPVLLRLTIARNRTRVLWWPALSFARESRGRFDEGPSGLAQMAPPPIRRAIAEVCPELTTAPQTPYR